MICYNFTNTICVNEKLYNNVTKIHSIIYQTTINIINNKQLLYKYHTSLKNITNLTINYINKYSFITTKCI